MLVYSPAYNTPLEQFGMVKPFALDRGQHVLQQLSADFARDFPYIEPEPITRSDALLVHTQAYLDSLDNPEVWQEIFELSTHDYFPDRALHPLNELFGDIALKCGGTYLACRLALEHHLSANLGAGYHHAFPDRGRGFCVLHDIAIAIRKLQKDGHARRIMVVDLDFHQGDGTALIFQDDADVFTLSVHSEEGWPEEKAVSNLDVSITAREAPLYLSKSRPRAPCPEV